MVTADAIPASGTTSPTTAELDIIYFIRVFTNTDQPGDSSLELTVYEDSDNDGTYEHQQTRVVPEGETSMKYWLLEGVEGASYDIEVAMSGDGVENPTVNSLNVHRRAYIERTGDGETIHSPVNTTIATGVGEASDGGIGSGAGTTTTAYPSTQTTTTGVRTSGSGKTVNATVGNIVTYPQDGATPSSSTVTAGSGTTTTRDGSVRSGTVSPVSPTSTLTVVGGAEPGTASGATGNGVTTTTTSGVETTSSTVTPRTVDPVTDNTALVSGTDSRTSIATANGITTTATASVTGSGVATGITTRPETAVDAVGIIEHTGSVSSTSIPSTATTDGTLTASEASGETAGTFTTTSDSSLVTATGGQSILSTASTSVSDPARSSTIVADTVHTTPRTGATAGQVQVTNTVIGVVDPKTATIGGGGIAASTMTARASTEYTEAVTDPTTLMAVGSDVPGTGITATTAGVGATAEASGSIGGAVTSVTGASNVSPAVGSGVISDGVTSVTGDATASQMSGTTHLVEPVTTVNEIAPKPLASGSATSASAIIGVGPYSSDVFPDDPTAYYALNSIEDGIAEDYSGNGFDALVDGGSARSVIGVSKSGADFRTNETVAARYDDGEFFPNGTAEFTVAGWLKTDTAKDVPAAISFGSPSIWSNELFIMYYGDSSNGNGIRIWHQDGGGTGGTVLKWETDLADNRWHHVSLTWDGTDGRLYIDGQEVDSYNNKNLDRFNPTSLSIGAANDGGALKQQFPGTADEVRFYDRTLSATEVRDLEHRTAPIQDPTIVEPGTASTASVSVDPITATGYPDDTIAQYHLDNDATDSSGNGYDAIETNDAQFVPDGRVDYGVEWQSSNGYIDLGDTLLNSPDEFTASAWVKNPGTEVAIVGRSNDWLLLIETDGDLGLAVWGDRSTDPTANVPDDDKWHHIAGVYSKSKDYFAVYVDGVEYDRRSPGDQPNGSSKPLRIGNGAWDVTTDAIYDEVRLYDTAISADGIRELATVPTAPAVIPESVPAAGTAAPQTIEPTTATTDGPTATTSTSTPIVTDGTTTQVETPLETTATATSSNGRPSALTVPSTPTTATTGPSIVDPKTDTTAGSLTSGAVTATGQVTGTTATTSNPEPENVSGNATTSTATTSVTAVADLARSPALNPVVNPLTATWAEGEIALGDVSAILESVIAETLDVDSVTEMKTIVIPISPTTQTVTNQATTPTAITVFDGNATTKTVTEIEPNQMSGIPGQVDPVTRAFSAAINATGDGTIRIADPHTATTDPAGLASTRTSPFGSATTSATNEVETPTPATTDTNWGLVELPLTVRWPATLADVLGTNQIIGSTDTTARGTAVEQNRPTVHDVDVDLSAQSVDITVQSYGVDVHDDNQPE